MARRVGHARRVGRAAGLLAACRLLTHRRRNRRQVVAVPFLALVFFQFLHLLFALQQLHYGQCKLHGSARSFTSDDIAVSFYRKDLEIGLFLIGRIKLIYLALFTFVIDLLAITSTNAGGHIAHIGGALFGIWFAARIKEGKDLTAPMNRLLDWVVNLGKRKPKMRVTYKRPETDYEYNARKHRETVDLDAILDKLKRSGYESLSAEEKKKLFDASKK